MKKYLLISSYLSAIILIFVSFTSVIGYQYTSSDAKGLSPLFNIRIQRAIDLADKDIQYEYLGKGEENSILFPIRDREVSLIYQAINKFNHMDDGLLRFNIQQINQMYLIKDMKIENLQGIINKLEQILQNNEEIIQNLHDDLDNPITKPFTIYRPLYILILLIFVIIFGLYIPLISLYAGVTCDPCCFIYDPTTFRI